MYIYVLVFVLLLLLVVVVSLFLSLLDGFAYLKWMTKEQSGFRQVEMS